MDWPVCMYLDQNMLHVVDLRDPSKDTAMGHATSIFRCEGRLYAVAGNDVMEITFAELPKVLLIFFQTLLTGS